MKGLKRIVCLLMAITLLLTSSLSLMAEEVKTEKKEIKKVLFIGNSFTYYNTVCNVVQGLAKRNGHDIEVKAATNGGKSLEYNSSAANVVSAIKEGGFDVVVLQDIVSTFDADKLQRGADKIIPIVKEYNPNAQIVFYEPWPKKYVIKNPNSRLPYFTDNYIKTANKVGAKLAPAGEAYYDIYVNYGKDYYCKDSLHPQPLGTFTSAATIYFTIFDEDELKPFEESEQKTLDDLILNNVAYAQEGILKSYPLKDLNLIYALGYKYSKAVVKAVAGEGKYVSIGTYVEKEETKPVKVKKIKITKATKKKNVIKVSFKKIKDITGVNIKVAKKKIFSKKYVIYNKSIKGKKTKLKIKSNKFKKYKSKKLFVKLQAYVVKNGKKTKGKWSKIKKVK